MCNSTIALTAVTIASAGLQYQAGKAQQKATYAAQKQRNSIARENAIRRYATEQLKIRQELKKSSRADYIATLKSRKVRSQFITEVGSAGIAISGSTEALMRDYYRTEGNYRNALVNNMNVNISQFERNLEAIQFGQKAQTTYEVPPNPALLFASSALNVANTYYGLEAQKELYGYKSNRQKAIDRNKFTQYGYKA